MVKFRLYRVLECIPDLHNNTMTDLSSRLLHALSILSKNSLPGDMAHFWVIASPPGTNLVLHDLYNISNNRAVIWDARTN